MICIFYVNLNILNQNLVIGPRFNYEYLKFRINISLVSIWVGHRGWDMDNFPYLKFLFKFIINILYKIKIKLHHLKNTSIVVYCRIFVNHNRRNVRNSMSYSINLFKVILVII